MYMNSVFHDPPAQDLEAAFRASRRADAFVAIEKKGKAAFAKVWRLGIIVQLEHTHARGREAETSFPVHAAHDQWCWTILTN